MAYTTYTYYTDTFNGFKIPSDKFDYYIGLSGDILDERINVDVSGVIGTYETKIKKADCLIAELLYIDDTSKEISSEKTLTYSVTYDTSRKMSLGNKITSILNRYLSDTGLLFGGLNRV